MQNSRVQCKFKFYFPCTIANEGFIRKELNIKKYIEWKDGKYHFGLNFFLYAFKQNMNHYCSIIVIAEQNAFEKGLSFLTPFFL